MERSKSSVHHHIQAKNKRNKHPESSLWETETGSIWLRLLVFAAIYLFGIKSGVGAETLSQFFKMIRIDTHVGVSPSALRTQMNKMEELLPKFQDECEKNIDKQTRKVVAGLDETFFGEFLILVLMDLSSGYLLLETITEDRCYDTWYEKTKPRLEGLGIAVNHAISDRAKALIKMAVTGFECESGADVFHAQQDVSRWLGARIGKSVARAEKKLEKAEEKEGKIKDSTKESRVITLKEQRIEAETELKEAKEVQTEYHENLQGIADEVHPFSLTDNCINDAEKVKERLELRAQAFENIAEKQAILDKRKVMIKFRNQFKSLAVSVDFWWLWVRETLQNLAVENVELEAWLKTTLLPVVYWHHKMRQTKHRYAKEKYRQAWEQASQVIKDHHGRGLSEKRLKSLTVIHNYGLKRADGTTAATRLFDMEFPDLFSWLLDKMDELPLPRKSRERIISNPLTLSGVPC